MLGSIIFPKKALSLLAAVLVVEYFFSIQNVSIFDSFGYWSLTTGIAWAPGFISFTEDSIAPSRVALYVFVTLLAFPFKVYVGVKIFESIPRNYYKTIIVTPLQRSKMGVREFVVGNDGRGEIGIFRSIIVSLIMLIMLVAFLVLQPWAWVNYSDEPKRVYSRFVVWGFSSGREKMWIGWSVIYALVLSSAAAMAYLIARDYAKWLVTIFIGDKDE